MGGFQGERKSGPPPKKDVWVCVVVALQERPLYLGTGTVQRVESPVAAAASSHRPHSNPSYTRGTPSSQATLVQDGNHTAKYSPMYRKSSNYTDQKRYTVYAYDHSDLAAEMAPLQPTN